MRPIGLALASMLAVAANDTAATKPPIHVPYRLAPTQHIIVRVKIDGHGPFNLMLDTGAPLVLLTKKIEAQVAAKPDQNGWAEIDRFEVEGGAAISKLTVRFEDIFQLEGMNGLGAAGVEIHGLLGYSVLARYRIEMDFAQPKLTWTQLDAAPKDLPRKGQSVAPAGLNALGGFMKTVGMFLGMHKPATVAQRGFLGLNVVERDGQLVVDTVLLDGPLGPSLQSGDVVTHLNSKATASIKALNAIQASLRSGVKTTITIKRGDSTIKFDFTVGEGF